MSPPRRKGLLPKSVTRTLWSMAAFFGVGYLPTIFLGNPVMGMGLATGLMIPFGSRAPTTLRGALWGGALGCFAGLAMFGALTTRYQGMPPPFPPHVSSTQPATAPSSAPATAPATAPVATTAPTTAPAAPVVTREDMRQIRMICVLGTSAMCAAVGAVFAYFGTRRRRRLDEDWAHRQTR